jgi:hypothetical protein
MLNLSYQTKEKKISLLCTFKSVLSASTHNTTTQTTTTPFHNLPPPPPPHPIRFKLLLSSRRVIIPIIRIISGERGRHVNHVKNVSFLSTFWRGGGGGCPRGSAEPGMPTHPQPPLRPKLTQTTNKNPPNSSPRKTREVNPYRIFSNGATVVEFADDKSERQLSRAPILRWWKLWIFFYFHAPKRV